MPKSIPQLSVDARMIFERLVASSVGEVIHYSELTELIGRNAQGGGVGAVTTARRKAMNERHMVFEAVRNQGLKRLSDVEVVDTTEHSLSKVRRASRRAVRRITNVAFDQLPNEKKIRHNTYISMFGALASITTGASMKRIETQVVALKDALPLAKTLEAFTEKK